MDDFTHFLFETGLIIDVTEDKNNNEVFNTQFFGKDFCEFDNTDEDEEYLNEDY